jgi:hypothetical protein
MQVKLIKINRTRPKFVKIFLLFLHSYKNSILMIRKGVFFLEMNSESKKNKTKSDYQLIRIKPYFIFNYFTYSL